MTSTITTPICIEPGLHRQHTMHVYADGDRTLVKTLECPGRYAGPRHLAVLGQCITCTKLATQTDTRPRWDNGKKWSASQTCDNCGHFMLITGNSITVYTHGQGHTSTLHPQPKHRAPTDLDTSPCLACGVSDDGLSTDGFCGDCLADLVPAGLVARSTHAIEQAS